MQLAEYLLIRSLCRFPSILCLSSFFLSVLASYCAICCISYIAPAVFSILSAVYDSSFFCTSSTAEKPCHRPFYIQDDLSRML